MKKQSYLIVAILMAMFSFSFLGCDREDPTPPGPDPGGDSTVVSPQLNILLEGDLQIDPQGGDYSVEYELLNEVAGGQLAVAVEEGCDWITSLNYNVKGVVTFTVPANESGADRATVLTLTYTYDEGETVEDAVNIAQALYEPPIVYDYEFELVCQSGYYYGSQYGVNGEHNYYTWLSDMPFDADGYTQPGGTYYLFDIFAPAPEDANNPKLPVGEYTLGEYGATSEFTFTPDYSMGMTLSEDAQSRPMDVTFTEGTLNVTMDGDNYFFEAKLVDQEGKRHHLTYSGPAVWEGEPLGYNPIEEDINVVANTALGSYMSDEAGTMYVTLQFTDMPVDSQGYVTSPGTILSVEAYMPFDENGYIAEGKYEISTTPGADFTLYYGELFDFLGMLFPMGTYASYIDEANTEYLGFATSGTMDVSGSNGYYDIEFNFTTEQGYNITGSYSGPLTIAGMPGEEEDGFSTLEGDYTLDLSNAVGYGSYYGDYYYTGGGNWYFVLEPSDGLTGDGLQVDLTGVGLDFNAGLPTDTYVAASTDYPEPGEYLVGYATSEGQLGGTLFIGGFDSMGYVSEFAPATEGDFNVTNHGDGTYTLSFSFLDDKGNTWDGEWTGEIIFDNYDTSSAGAPSRMSAGFRNNPITQSEKIEILKQNRLQPITLTSAKATGRKVVK